MIRVKICGLTRPQDAQAAVAAGADAVGLVFAPSRRRVSPALAKTILQGLPTYVLRVGVFVDQDPEWIRGLVEHLGLDRIQFHGHESASQLRQFPFGRVIRALRPLAGAVAPQRDPAPSASALLVDAYSPQAMGGSGVVSNWVYARDLKRFKKTLILSGGLNPGNVAAAIRQVQPDMVDVASGVEIAPGIKSAAKIKAFMQAVHRCA